jgi:amino acid adenylation domain-containing protein
MLSLEKYFLSFLFDDNHDAENALCINDTYYTYKELKCKTATVVKEIIEKKLKQQSIGVYLDDNIETYAAILAIWYTGNIYIPLHPTYPPERIDNIIHIANIQLIFSTTNPIEGLESKTEIVYFDAINRMDKLDQGDLHYYDSQDVVYVLFTSGSTGVPKGVQISYQNLFSFLENLEKIGLDIPARSGYLQMFELTFDLSIVSMLFPFMNSGILYHVSSKSVKYLEIYRLLEEYSIQFAILVPSVLSMLRPYFDSISLHDLKFVGLSGEAVPLGLTQEWQSCCPNAQFFNFYGPTECTIFCTYYKIPRSDIESQNGIVSIGHINHNLKSLCLREDGGVASVGEKSLLWIGGDQVSPGYINNGELNKNLFKEIDGLAFYNTGDIVVQNEKNNFYYLGRQDHQVKISGYRIELTEVEYNASRALGGKAFVIAVNDPKSLSLKLVLFIEKTSLSSSSLLSQLKTTLPDYMLPATIIQLEEFPLNKNGKLDRGQLKEIYEKHG